MIKNLYHQTPRLIISKLEYPKPASNLLNLNKYLQNIHKQITKSLRTLQIPNYSYQILQNELKHKIFFYTNITNLASHMPSDFNLILIKKNQKLLNLSQILQFQTQITH